jgi:hypothetical protein
VAGSIQNQRQHCQSTASFFTFTAAFPLRLGRGEQRAQETKDVSCYEEHVSIFSTSISLFVIVFFSRTRFEQKIRLIVFGSLGGNGLKDLRCFFIFEWDYVGPTWS